MDKDVIHTFMYTHTHIMKYYSAIKNNAICSNMDGPRGIILRQTDKDKYLIISVLCGI